MVGILLIHGFAGTREEIKPLYNFLCGKGFLVVMPLLAGHEGTAKDLSAARYEQWLESAEKEYITLSKQSDKVIVIGFSMGGLVAVNLYQKYKFDGLVTINTPVYYWDIKRIIKNLLNDFNTYAKKYFLSGANKPLFALLGFLKLLNRTKSLYKCVDCTALVIQTQDDDTVNPKSAEYIFGNLKGTKQIYKQQNGGHIVFQSSDYQAVLDVVYAFVREYYEEAAKGAGCEKIRSDYEVAGILPFENTNS